MNVFGAFIGRVHSVWSPEEKDRLDKTHDFNAKLMNFTAKLMKFTAKLIVFHATWAGS